MSKVRAYTRADGTKVKEHFRAGNPSGGGATAPVVSPRPPTRPQGGSKLCQNPVSEPTPYDDMLAQAKAKIQQRQSLPPGGSVGGPHTFTAIHHEQQTPYFGAEFGQDLEPAGKYVSQWTGLRWPTHFDDIYERFTVTLERPLLLDFGGDYATATNWKTRLSEHYAGKTGVELSAALIEDGFDGIITYDKYGPSETILLQT